MNYNEWLDIIELLKRSNRNYQYLERIKKTAYNQNIEEMLTPKLEELIIEKLKKAIRNVINDIKETFHNPNSLDIAICNFEKDIQFAKDICLIKQISEDTRNRLIDYIEKEKDIVYEILIKKALEIDPSGMYKSIIEKKKKKR
jgi:Zn-dependent M32 family carboxypeptidase